DSIDIAFVKSQPEFARAIDDPGHIFAGVDAVCAHDPICKNKRRRSHARHTDAFAFQIFDRANISFYARLHAQTATVNSTRETHVESLLQRLQEIHDQMMRNVESTE